MGTVFGIQTTYEVRENRKRIAIETVMKKDKKENKPIIAQRLSISNKRIRLADGSNGGDDDKKQRSVTKSDETSVQFVLNVDDHISTIFSFLDQSDLLQVASVKKTWLAAADKVAERRLIETSTKHVVSNDWQKRLEAEYRENALSHINAFLRCSETKYLSNFVEEPTQAPTRCLWNIAQVLPLNQMKVSFGDDSDAVGIPLATGGLALAIVGALNYHDFIFVSNFPCSNPNKAAVWKRYCPRTGHVSSATKDELRLQDRWSNYVGDVSGSIQVFGNLVVYLRCNDPYDNPETLFTVFRVKENGELDFLHCTEFDDSLRSALPVGVYGDYQFRMCGERMGSLACEFCYYCWDEEDFEAEAHDEHFQTLFTEEMVTRFALVREKYQCCVRQVGYYDIETGQFQGFQDAPFVRREETYYDDLRDICDRKYHANGNKLWITKAWNVPGESTCIDVVDQSLPGQPIVKTLKTKEDSRPPPRGIYSCQEDVIVYLDTYYFGQGNYRKDKKEAILQTFLP